MPRRRRKTSVGLSKKHRTIVTVAAAIALIAVVFHFTDDSLWRAIVKVESGGNTRAWNKTTDAVGIAQIRKTVVDDCNRILGHKRFSYNDRWSRRASRRMFDIYLNYWARHYEKQTGRAATAEIRARIWNGGPNGWKYRETEDYWERVRRYY